MDLKFRKLKTNEIDCRVATINKETGISVLLYKDARVDMNMLDEVVGAMNWKREHTRDNANCIVSIWDDHKLQWVSKEDTGIESFSEKEKGLASDSFKRACFNWGIGRELYTAPFIWINADKVEIAEKIGKDGKTKLTTNDKLAVSKIDYDADGNISELEITSNKKGVVFYWGKKQETLAETSKKAKAEPKKAISKEEKIQKYKDYLNLLTVEEYNKKSEEGKGKIQKMLMAVEDLPFASDTDVIAFLKNKK